jgi:hypothetical protein
MVRRLSLAFITLPLGLLVCVGLGVAWYVPQTELITGFRSIFGTFTTTMTGVIILAGVLLTLAGIVAFLWLLGWFGEARAVVVADRQRREALAKKEDAEALRAWREANTVITIARPGDQVFVTEVSPDTTTRPAHLAAGPANGKPVNFTVEEWQRWAFYNAMHATNGGNSQNGQSMHPLIEAPAPWPDRVNLADLLADGQGDLNNIILGVTPDRGRLAPLTAPLEKMVHVAVGGASGWGKSEFLRAFCFQVATAPQLAELALIDLEAATFSPFARSGKLRYPIADDERDILAILADLVDEMNRRKELYRPWPEADKLSIYNRLGDEPLPVIALLIDEATAIFGENKDIEQAARTLALRGRKYGLYVVAGGQSWKASDFDSSIRGQFSTTIHFHAKDKTSSRVLLGDPAAADLDRIGGAFVVLPGRPMVEIQSPAISLMHTTRALQVGNQAGPPTMPALPDPEPTLEDEQDEHFKDLVDSGESRRAAALEAYGKEYAGAIVTRGKRALREID